MRFEILTFQILRYCTSRRFTGIPASLRFTALTLGRSSMSRCEGTARGSRSAWPLHSRRLVLLLPQEPLVCRSILVNDWLIILCFTPYRWYFGHITATTFNKRWSFVKFWSFPDGPHESTLHRNPVKRSFACQGGCYPWHGAPFNVPSAAHFVRVIARVTRIWLLPA